MNIKDKLNNLTGLQRVFLVAFLVCWGYFALWHSMSETDKARQVNSYYRLAVLKDFDNPACLPYTTMPMSQLTEPKFSTGGGSCWHIYTHRSYGSETKLPFTKESYDSSQSIVYWETFLANLGIFSLVVVMVFVLIALIYKIGCWIFAGFKKHK